MTPFDKASTHHELNESLNSTNSTSHLQTNELYEMTPYEFDGASTYHEVNESLNSMNSMSHLQINVSSTHHKFVRSFKRQNYTTVCRVIEINLTNLMRNESRHM